MDIKGFLGTLGVLNDDQKISITNCVVMLFVGITAFKVMFSGLTFENSLFSWKVESLDTTTTLPLLFSLMNYGHRRMIQTDTKESQ
jgi:hypothetical protein